MTTDQQLKTATVTLPADREVKIERILDAPRERVFATVTNPDLIPEWWGPRSTKVTVETMDVRVGGEWRFLVIDSDGNDTAFRGTYREVSPPERLVQTFEWEGMPGYISLEIATYEDLGDGRTKATTVSHFFTPEDRDGTVSSGMEQGMQETYQRLDEVLARQA